MPLVESPGQLEESSLALKLRLPFAVGESGSSGDSSPQENTMRISPGEKTMMRPTLVMASPVIWMPPDCCLIGVADAGRPAIASGQRRRGQG